MSRRHPIRVAFWPVVICASIATSQLLAAEDDARVSGGASITIGQRLKIQSKALGETRTYLVHKPNRYDFTKEAYPVLIVLDGIDHFAHTSATMEFLANNGLMPQMIVVGITNTDRGRDMTPPLTIPPVKPRQGATGGIDKFLSFIGDELLPEIDRTYRTRPYRVLVGHSLGGLAAVYSLVKRPELFNGYIAISPSLWWDNQTLVKEAEVFLTSRKELRADFYMTMADEDTAMLGGAWKLAAFMEEQRPKSLRWQFVRSPEETHGTIPYRSTYNGLQFIFDGWNIRDDVAMFEQSGFAGIDAHYEKLSARVGYPVPMPDHIFGGLFYTFLGEERYADAERVVNRAMELFPDGSHIYLSAGQLYAAMKDERRTVEYMTKVLTMFPGSRDARNALAEYKVDVTKIVPDVKLPDKSLAAIVGLYRAPNIDMEITREGDKLFAATDYGKTEIRPLSDRKFYYMNVDNDLEFHTDKRGKIVRMTMDRNGDRYEYVKVN